MGAVAEPRRADHSRSDRGVPAGGGPLPHRSGDGAAARRWERPGGGERTPVPVGGPISPQGTLGVGGLGFVLKYAADGKLLWTRAVGRAGTVHYY